MEEINLSINGKAINCLPDMSILDAATENGIKIPTLCNHIHLRPAGACRLCMVEEEKSGRIFASCVTPVSMDMVIHTNTPAIIKYRTDIIRLMMASHPESCILCNQGNRCELRQVAADLGVGKIDLYPMPHYTGLEEANPFIIRDLSKCILCGRCIRADHELVTVGAIDYNLRGFKSRPATVHELPLEKSSCTFCGTCVSLCPTGALMTKNTRYAGSPQMESSTICGFCGVGCALVMGSVDGQVVEVNPSHEGGTVNLSTLCVRGHFAHDFLNSPERLINPLIRRDNELSPASWDEVLELVAERLTSIKKENGPQSLAFLGSSKCTNEENYLFQKMARVFFGTNNIDNGGYVSGRPVIYSINERLDGGERIKPLKDLEKAELIFILGADPIQSAPVVGYYLKGASRINKVPLIVADPRKTDLLPFASVWLQIAPQTDCELINGLAAVLYRQKSYDTDFINKFTEDFNLYKDSLAGLDLDRVARITGVDRKLIERAGSLINGKQVAFVVGHGILQQRYGNSAMEALMNLALMTGSVGGVGNGIYLLSRENNQTGSLDMGVAPDYLPGRQPLHDEMIRRHWERGWDITISPDRGLDMVRMVEEAEKGNLKALYIMGENPLRSLPQSGRVKKALESLELLVVQDI
ncbi:molybdopterin-dependent oxidoreductase, partial [Thermodesulfobacteriota bacterium]